jgi:glyoxylase-like metal-dependent hydrolase (beta-lactamase superfamily II)
MEDPKQTNSVNRENDLKRMSQSAALHIETIEIPLLPNNVFVLSDATTREAAILDPGINSDFILEHIRAAGLELVAILNTHGHFDHVAGNAFFKQETGAPLYLHQADVDVAVHANEMAAWFGLSVPDSPPPDVLWQGGETFTLGTRTFQVRPAPGHSPGGVCLITDGAAFVGDVLFAGSIGRTDLPGGHYETLLGSIRRELLTLPDDTAVYSGHGPPTTIGREKRYNPFCRRDA